MRSRPPRSSSRERAPEGPTELALEQWRDAAKRVERHNRAWQAAERCDRHSRYVAFLGALHSEEQAALRVAGCTGQASGPARPT